VQPPLTTIRLPSPPALTLGGAQTMVSCLISWVGSRVRRLGDVQRRRKFHGPTPSMRWGVILVMYPGGGSGVAGKMTSGPR
jgi:hypothetical protein